ncbi:hypothetical protein OCAR_5361 [Afipia carboxidovorans OM5]|nr:hypothetical protein OCAR_5361 [Afipia carboxidovorans OM5]
MHSSSGDRHEPIEGYERKRPSRILIWQIIASKNRSICGCMTSLIGHHDARGER